jgi:hypothetical protein
VSSRPVFLAVVTAGLLLVASNARAQSVTALLTRLLTEQQPTSDFEPDQNAHIVTLTTVAGLFSVELTTIPITSSSGGFVYRLNPSLGTVGRASNGFGPFFTESVLRGGRNQTGFGIRLQHASFDSLQGADLRSGTFPTNATRLTGAAEPFSVELLRLKLETSTAFFVGSYGVTNWLSVGGSLPVVHLRASGNRVRALNGVNTLQSSVSGTATGLGDVALHARARIAGHGARGIAIGADVRFPTGREEDLLGTGKTATRALVIGSWEDGRLAVHINGGGAVGGLTDELFWSGATSFAPWSRLTIVGEIIGRRLSELSRLKDVYEPYPGLANLETMRWVPIERGIDTTFVVIGSKWNVARSWLFNAGVLIRLTDNGLRSRVTPTVSLDFDFQR